MENTNYDVSYVRVAVNDIEKAKNFYEDILGMSLIVDRTEEGYILLNLGCTTLIVENTDSNDFDLPVGRYLGISIKVTNIQKVYEALLAENVKFSHPPQKQFWGGYMTEFSDPEGNVWTLLG